MIVRLNSPHIFTLELLVSLVFLGHHIIVFFIFHCYAWYDLSLFNLDIIINLGNHLTNILGLKIYFKESKQMLYIYILIGKAQIENSIRIQFCTMCLKLCEDHTIINYPLKFVSCVHLSFLIFMPSELISAKY